MAPFLKLWEAYAVSRMSLNTSLNLTQIRRLNPRAIFVALVLYSMTIELSSTQFRGMN